MTDTQYQIIDELYFVTSFADLMQASGLPTEILQQELAALLATGWVKALYPVPDQDQPFDPGHFEAHGRMYFFLATKAGLLAHNSR